MKLTAWADTIGEDRVAAITKSLAADHVEIAAYALPDEEGDGWRVLVATTGGLYDCRPLAQAEYAGKWAHRCRTYGWPYVKGLSGPTYVAWGDGAPGPGGSFHLRAEVPDIGVTTSEPEMLKALKDFARACQDWQQRMRHLRPFCPKCGSAAWSRDRELVVQEFAGQEPIKRRNYGRGGGPQYWTCIQCGEVVDQPSSPLVRALDAIPLEGV